MAVDAVIFDWGGTLTPWITVDDQVWVRVATRLAAAGVVAADQVTQVARRLEEAGDDVWRRAREDNLSATMADMFAAAGLPHDEVTLAAHDAEWEHATFTDPQAPELLSGLRARGIKVGVLSNTTWSRRRHQEIFARDGVDSLIDGAVYSSEIAYTKPHPEAFRAAMAAVGMSDPARCVFVGDRPFDDIFGAHQAGMRAVLLPHSDIPAVQRGHTQGDPDAVILELGQLLAVVDAWRQAEADDRAGFSAG